MAPKLPVMVLARVAAFADDNTVWNMGVALGGDFVHWAGPLIARVATGRALRLSIRLGFAGHDPFVFSKKELFYPDLVPVELFSWR